MANVKKQEKAKKKVLVCGVGPGCRITYNNELLSNGAYIEMDEDVANAYITVGLCKESTQEEAEALQKLESQNEKTRARIIAKAQGKYDPNVQKGGLKNE